MSDAEVVISYRREDSGTAGRLSDWLGSHFGASRIFMDVTGIRVGESFPAVITEVIGNCKAVVAVVTPNWAADLANSEDWVRRELREALELGRPILPVLLHGGELQASDLPAELVPLASIQALTVADADFRDDVGLLIERLEEIGVESASRRPYPEIPERSRAEARAAWDAFIAPARVRDLLVAPLAERGIKIKGSEGDELLLAGGSKLKLRLLGGLTGPESRLPMTGRMLIRDRGTSVAIDVLLEENVGAAVFSGLKGRYASHFEKTIEGLRTATKRR